jgi:hypothetical protein
MPALIYSGASITGTNPSPSTRGTSAYCTACLCYSLTADTTLSGASVSVTEHTDGRGLGGAPYHSLHPPLTPGRGRRGKRGPWARALVDVRLAGCWLV